MKKPLLAAAALLLAIPLMTPRAEAQVAFVPYIGYDFDVGNGSFLVGVGAEFGLLPAGALPFAVQIRPSAEYYFVDSPANVDFTFFQINADALATVATAPGLGFFAGAGLGIGFSSASAGGVSESQTDFGLNLLGGLEFDTGFVSPFVQARFTIMDGTRFGILGGVKLAL